MTTTSKKSSTRKTSVAKKPTKRTASKASRGKSEAMKSFKLSKSDTPFLTFSLSKQTLYWAVFGLVVVAFSLWIFKIQADVNAIYDQIDQSITTE